MSYLTLVASLIHSIVKVKFSYELLVISAVAERVTEHLGAARIHSIDTVDFSYELLVKVIFGASRFCGLGN